MKPIHLLVFILIYSLNTQNAWAQNTAEKTDTSKFLNGHMTIIAKEKDGKKKSATVNLSSKSKDSTRKVLETHWGSFDIGFCNYQDNTNYNGLSSLSEEDQSFFRSMHSPNKHDFELRSGKSLNINIGIVKAQLSLYKHYVSLVSGITYDISNWSYKNAIVWNKQPDFQTGLLFENEYITRDTVHTYKKNKLVTNYLQVPLLLRIETSPKHENRNVFISAGGYVGYLVRVHTKQIQNGNEDVVKHFDDYNITKFQYGAQVEIGYKDISFYVKKSVTPLTEFGTDQYPYSFGIRLSGL